MTLTVSWLVLIDQFRTCRAEQPAEIRQVGGLFTVALCRKTEIFLLKSFGKIDRENIAVRMFRQQFRNTYPLAEKRAGMTAIQSKDLICGTGFQTDDRFHTAEIKTFIRQFSQVHRHLVQNKGDLAEVLQVGSVR